jgi:hypothetical protein
MDDFYDDDEMFGSGQKLEAEANVFQRVGPTSKLAEMLSVPLAIDPTKKGREAIPPEDRFLINVDSLCRRMTSENIWKLTEPDITYILEKTTQIVGLKYKNYVGYVLGYIATQGGRSMKKENIMNVIEKILPRLEDEGGVKAPDVIRYSRFWKDSL